MINNGNEFFQINVISGNKFGIVNFDISFESSKKPKPNKLFGYWKEKIHDAHNDEYLIGDRIWYEFECIDPNYLEFVF